MASRFWVGGTGSWTAANTANWAATSGGASGVSVPVDGDTVTFDAASGGGVVTVGPAYNPTVTSITMGAFTGTLDFSANNNSPTMNTLNCSGTGTRTLNMGSGTWTLRGNAGTIWDTGTTTNLTLNAGTSTVNFNYSGSTGTRTISIGGASAALGLNNVTVSAGTDIFVHNLTGGFINGNLDFTGFTGTYTPSTTLSLGGNFTLNSGMTVTSRAEVLSFVGSGTQTITSNGVQQNHPITINSTGTVILADALDIGGASTRTLTLTAGTFNANNFNVTCGIFLSSNSNVRTLTMGSGTWTITGNSTIVFGWTTFTNLTLDIGTAVVNLNYSGASGTRAVRSGDSSTYQLPPINITAGSDTIETSGGSTSFHVKSLNFTGFTGTWGLTGSFSSQNLYGNLTLGTGMTVANTSGGKILNFVGSTSMILESNGVNLKADVVMNSAGNSLTLADNLDLTNAVDPSIIMLTAGTFNANNCNVTTGSFVSSNSNVRTLTMGTETWTLTGTGIVWNTATTTNLTLNADTSTIVVNDASASSKTLSLGASTYYNLRLTGGGTGTMIIGTSTGTKTFHAIRVDEPLTVQVFAGSTIVLTTTQFNVTGNAGQFNTFESTSAGTPWTLSVASGVVVADYISLQDAVATGGATFYAGVHSTDVSNNSGWLFSNQVGGGETAKIDANGTRTMMAVSSADFETPIRLAVDATTGALLVTVD